MIPLSVHINWFPVQLIRFLIHFIVFLVQLNRVPDHIKQEKVQLGGKKNELDELMIKEDGNADDSGEEIKLEKFPQQS